MRIYKKIHCPDCGEEVTLNWEGDFYIGICKVCDKDIIENSYGDEQSINNLF